MTVVAYPAPGLFEANSNNGAPLAGGLLYAYASGTSNPIDTFQDSGATILNTNPVVLNFRGEASVFLQFNVGYKLNLTDSLGNQIPGWPIDNIYNPVLTTLYGGVDTGVSNAYVLNYLANFTSLVDGIVIYFKAANTNSSTSTLNVNNLGVITILQQNGQLLQPGMIGANTVIEVIYIAGNFYLISSAYTAPQASNFSMIPSGFNPVLGSILVDYVSASGIVTLTFPVFSGTSNNIQFTLAGLPLTLQPATDHSVPIAGPVQDNGSFITTGVAQISAGSSLITLSPTASTDWTASGTKGMGEVTVRPFPIPPIIDTATITYPLT